MARTVEFGEDGERRVTEDGTTYREAPEAVTHELAPMPEAPKVSRTQARAAANMRYAGADWTEIADYFDYKDAAIARQVVEAHIAKAFPAASHEALFQMVDGRLEQLLRGVWSKTLPKVPMLDEQGRTVRGADGKPVMVENPDQIAYTKIALDITSRKARLHGLDAPTRVEISPGQERLSELMDQMIELSGKQPAAEGDVFEDIEDAEIVEGDL